MTELQQNTEEWLEFRRNKIGSSDAPIIMGKSPWKTPQQLWEEKMGITDSSYDSTAMRRGRDLEPVARKEFERQTGLVVWPDVLIHSEHDFIIASLDGITMDGKIAVEIKCPGEKTHKMATEGKIPEHYQIQMQHQLAVTGQEWMYYFSFDGKKGIIIEVKRDDLMIDSMITKETEFYRFIKDRIPPTQLKNDDFWKLQASRWKELQKKKQEIEEAEKECRQELISLAGGKTAYGCGVKLTKYNKKGRVAYEKIPELEGVDLENYRQASVEAWRLTLKS